MPGCWTPTRSKGKQKLGAKSYVLKRSIEMQIGAMDLRRGVLGILAYIYNDPDPNHTQISTQTCCIPVCVKGLRHPSLIKGLGEIEGEQPCAGGSKF